MKKSELQSIIREEIESALGEKNILSEAKEYTWDVTQHESHKWALGKRKDGNYRVVEWKKGQTVTVKAGTSFGAVKMALAEIWGVDSNSKASEWPKSYDVKQFSGNVKKR